MALVGGGGAGNVAGSNPAGTGSSVNYIGKHAYAYSGAVSVPGNALTELLNFDTGNQYILATWSVSGAFSTAANGTIQFVMEINGEDVINTTYSPAYDHGYADYPESVLLPPNSNIVTKMQHNQGGIDIDFLHVVIGEVY